MNPVLKRSLSLLGLVAILAFAFSPVSETVHSVVDLRAALLVLFAPLCVLGIFAKETVSWSSMFGRVKQLRQQNSAQLTNELLRSTQDMQNGHAIAGAVTATERSSDPFLRFGGRLLAAKFDKDTMADLLSKRMATEDAQWQAMYNLAGFMAKMAPYFGMLATVIGMIQVLNNMTDFSRISGSMALAMQGTLYGLMSFTLLYSPLQKWILGYRNQIFKRNEMIADWLMAVAGKADVLAIQESLRSRSIDGAVETP